MIMNSIIMYMYVFSVTCKKKDVGMGFVACHHPSMHTAISIPGLYSFWHGHCYIFIYFYEMFLTGFSLYSTCNIMCIHIAKTLRCVNFHTLNMYINVEGKGSGYTPGWQDFRSIME